MKNVENLNFSTWDCKYPIVEEFTPKRSIMPDKGTTFDQLSYFECENGKKFFPFYHFHLACCGTN